MLLKAFLVFLCFASALARVQSLTKRTGLAESELRMLSTGFTPDGYFTEIQKI